MTKFFRSLVVGTALALGVAAIATAADKPDPAVGTWTLNLEKSKFTPGPAPKSQTRTYTQTADGLSLSVEGVAADGSAISQKSTFKYDGDSYAYTGSPDFDSLKLKKINGSTVKSTQLLGGKVVGTSIRTISAHGKVLTLSSKGKSASGARFHNVYVYDKQ